MIDLLCPLCGKEFPRAADPECRICGVPVIQLLAKHRGGKDSHGIRWVCTRRGCSGHHLGEEGLSLDAHVVSMMAHRFEFKEGEVFGSGKDE